MGAGLKRGVRQRSEPQLYIKLKLSKEKAFQPSRGTSDWAELHEKLAKGSDKKIDYVKLYKLISLCCILCINQ